jgi:hypothetical protein
MLSLQAFEFLTNPVDFDLVKESSSDSCPPHGLTERGEGAVEELDDPIRSRGPADRRKGAAAELGLGRS